MFCQNVIFPVAGITTNMPASLVEELEVNAPSGKGSMCFGDGSGMLNVEKSLGLIEEEPDE